MSRSGDGHVRFIPKGGNVWCSDPCFLRVNSGCLPLLAVPPQTASVQLSEKANADVEKGRPSRSRGHDCPLASMPLRTRRVPKYQYRASAVAPVGDLVRLRVDEQRLA